MDYEFDDAYFMADSAETVACIPITKLDSMYVKKLDDGYWGVVFVTCAGKEYPLILFETIESAQKFCEQQMEKVSNYIYAISKGERYYDK